MVKLYYDDKDTYKIFPSKISCFIGDPWNIAIIQCAEEMTENKWEDDEYPIVERRKLNAQYEMVYTDAINDTCNVITDIGNYGGNEYIVIHSMDTWGDEFRTLSFD